MSRGHSRGLTSRQIRRIGERELQKDQRRKAVEAFWALSPEERARKMKDMEAFERINRNGITVEDMHKVETDAYADGVRDGKEATIRTCFAAVCLTLHALHGFGKKRCSDVLNDVYERLTMALTSEEAIQEVYDAMGLQIRFTDGVTEDAVTEVS